MESLLPAVPSPHKPTTPADLSVPDRPLPTYATLSVEALNPADLFMPGLPTYLNANVETLTPADLSVPGWPLPTSVNPTPTAAGMASSACGPAVPGGAMPMAISVRHILLLGLL